MTGLVVRSYPQGPRVWVVNQRLHHGATGCAMLLSATLTHRQRRAMALVGLVLAAHDRRDWRVWFARESLPPAITLDTSSYPQ